ncbi:uncharacterized protein [Spinacia oleracea]|uniref:Uncharacterized protein isoform X2 n=1 Tax=Spinacia oleracea TaxID=3562 RepID=A0A9R0HYW3_SPIOL|nr:uncharacterized protein LOC110779079 isoform X2 [Spinacia oleracea]
MFVKLRGCKWCSSSSFLAFYFVELISLISCVMVSLVGFWVNGLGMARVMSLFSLFFVLVVGPLVCLFWVNLFWVAWYFFSVFRWVVSPYEVVVVLVKFPGTLMWEFLIQKPGIGMLGLVNKCMEVMRVNDISSFGQFWSLGGRLSLCGVRNAGGSVLGAMSREGDMCGRGFEFTLVMVVRSVMGLTNVNSHFRLAITVFVAFKTSYFNAAPHFMRIYSMLFESLLVIHAVCEQITSPLQPGRVITTLLLLSLGLKCFRFLREPPLYFPSISVFYKETIKIDFGMLLLVWQCKQSQVNNRGPSEKI